MPPWEQRPRPLQMKALDPPEVWPLHQGLSQEPEVGPLHEGLSQESVESLQPLERPASGRQH